LEEGRLTLDTELYNKTVKWINNIRYHTEEERDNMDTITVDSNLHGEVIKKNFQVSLQDLKLDTHRQIKTILDDIKINVLTPEKKPDNIQKVNLGYRQVNIYNHRD
jgi:hypothetical protein